MTNICTTIHTDTICKCTQWKWLLPFFVSTNTLLTYIHTCTSNPSTAVLRLLALCCKCCRNVRPQLHGSPREYGTRCGTHSRHMVRCLTYPSTSRFTKPPKHSIHAPSIEPTNWSSGTFVHIFIHPLLHPSSPIQHPPTHPAISLSIHQPIYLQHYYAPHYWTRTKRQMAPTPKK